MEARDAVRSEALRLAIVGCGRVVERCHLAAIEACSEWTLVAACDVRGDRRRWIREVRPSLVVCADAEELCRAARLHAVLIATPPETHCELALRYLESGLHVLVEKPMALSTPEARRMVEAARAHRRCLWVGFNRRFFGAYRSLKERLAAAQSGDVQAIRLRMSLAGVAWNPVTQYLDEETKGGGVLYDVASHQLDLLAWMTDGPVESIQVIESAGTTARGPTGIVYRARLAGGRLAECVAEHGRRYSEQVEVVLSSRRLLAHPSGVAESSRTVATGTGVRLFPARLADAVRCRLAWRPSPMQRSVQDLLHSFSAAIRDAGGHQGCEALAGLGAVLAVEAARQALATPRAWIPVPRP